MKDVLKYGFEISEDCIIAKSTDREQRSREIEEGD